MEKNNSKISIRVLNKDYLFLYDLLKERNPQANISHKKMPSYAQHIKFVNSRPYTKWYIIEKGNEMVGSVYLSKQNEIGIFLKKKFQNQGIGNKILDLIIKKNPRKRYLANVNPKNEKSISFFKQNKFRLIQYTFELNK
jgi:RimJ/RimL family protein N-acetyltransferase